MITLRNITLRRGVKVVLQDAGVVLQPGEKVGLIGRNGAGKSSLFSLLAGRLHADAGDVEIPPRWRLGEVAQDMPDTEDGAAEFVLQGDMPLQAAQAELAAAEAADDGDAIAHAHLALDEAGAFDARSRAESLLLDEPTNHLDLDALVWLEAWLKRYDGLMIVISHDREFLDAVTRVIVHLDEGQLTRYTGNYTAFEEMRAERLMQAQAAFSKQQDRIAHLQRFIDRFKAKASKAKQAQSRVKALARMERLAPAMTASDFNFEFREPASLPNPMLSFDGLACGYGKRAIVSNFSRSVLAGQRIGILGANGQGKSTLVKTIAGSLPLISGTTTQGKGLVIGYFAQQELDVLQLDDGALMHMVRLARDVGPAAREQQLRDFLGQFRFTGDMVTQPVGSLSGGEKARLVLAMLVWQRPNLLLLDEPTNHLDLTTREALSIALNEFEGTVMLVSHDRALLRETCDEFWLVARGRVEPFDGDLDDYQKWLLDVSRATARGQPIPDPPRAPVVASVSERAAPAPAPRAPAPPPAATRDERKNAKQARAKQSEATRPLRLELQRIDERLARLATEKQALEQQLSHPATSGDAYAELGRNLTHAAAETAMLEERWLELQSELEGLQAGG